MSLRRHKDRRKKRKSRYLTGIRTDTAPARVPYKITENGGALVI